MKSKKFDNHIKDANFEVEPSADFVDRVMKHVDPPRFMWLRPYAAAVPVFLMVILALPMTRNAVLEQLYPERAVASSVDNELNEISRLFDELSYDFDDSNLENLEE